MPLAVLYQLDLKAMTFVMILVSSVYENASLTINRNLLKTISIKINSNLANLEGLCYFKHLKGKKLVKSPTKKRAEEKLGRRMEKDNNL